MAVYDEDLLKNPFYAALEKQRPDLCVRVAESHGIVLVPCRGSLTLPAYTAAQFNTYVLQPAGEGYKTLDGKEISIQDRQVRLGAGFQAPASVPILFEETFYNDKEQSYSILCISRPIHTDQSQAEQSPGPALYCLRNVEDVKEFLGRHTEKLDRFISSFCHSFREQERRGLRHHIDSVNALYTKCVQCLLRDSRLKLLAKQELQMTLLKQAVEMYIHHGIHDLIFNFVGTLEANQDAAFNKTTRSLQDLQLKDLGVKPEFSINIPRAKRALGDLNHCTSPLHKVLCLRKVALTITQSPSRTVSIEAVCADDLLSVILYLLVKTEIPNWMANLSYIKNFRFSQSAKDDLSYCLTSFEAAVEFISQGNLLQGRPSCGDLNDKTVFRQKMSLLSQNAATPIDCLFEHIAGGNEAEVERLLGEAEREEEELRMCHPLCSCARCELQLSGRLNDPSVVTPFSRDDRGYTPLHVAALCGQSGLIDLLVSKGAVVNASDYHALTPLHLSCQKGYQGVTLLLLHYKANTDALDNNGNSPLHLACMYGHEDCVKALVYYDLHTCRLNIQNEKGDTCLHVSARWGYEGILQVLLENGASTDVCNKARETPLHCALNSKILTLLELTRNGTHQTERNTSPGRSPPASDSGSRRSSQSSCSSFSPDAQPEGDRGRQRQVEKLLRAVADGDIEMVRYLLEWVDEEPEEEEDAEMLSQTELCHPLCQCPRCAPTQKLACLQAGGVGVNSSSADGFTPLHVAALHGHASLVTLLARHGANVNGRNRHRATPLHLASQNSHTQVVTSLLECNAKLNKKDHYGNTPLIQACLRGHLDSAVLLIQSDAVVNLANQQGNTALHEAVRVGHLGLVEQLLQAGALVHLRNNRQRTPLDCAQETGGKNTEILRILQKASGLSPDAEPIKLLSVPKGTLAHSFVQRLKPQDQDQARRQKLAHSISRIQQMKKGLPRERSVPSLPSTARPQEVDGRGERGRLRRGETLESCGPFSRSGSPVQGAGDRARPLGRCHTVDPERPPSPHWGVHACDPLVQDWQTDGSKVQTHAPEELSVMNPSSEIFHTNVTDSPIELCLTDTPNEPSHTDTPNEPSHTDTPNEPSHTDTPNEPSHTDTPNEPSHTDTPNEPSHTDTPNEPSHTDTPNEPSHTDTPNEPSHTDTPNEPSHTDTPNEPSHTDTPNEPSHTDTPNEPSHTDTPNEPPHTDTPNEPPHTPNEPPHTPNEPPHTPNEPPHTPIEPSPTHTPYQPSDTQLPRESLPSNTPSNMNGEGEEGDGEGEEGVLLFSEHTDALPVWNWQENPPKEKEDLVSETA
ncbi:ankyrin repeat domain-containing protein 27 [Osmerus mordax]|uniref:ankyrin repeat domain-containing protein 27 n=1 Tax=Osmerus mordax TaxID=8014 RepID=UPI003510868F